MLKHLTKSLVLIAPLLLQQWHVHAEEVFDVDSDLEELSADGLSLTPENPLTPFALKKNGKARRKFKVPFSVLSDYYKYVGYGTIVENEAPEPLLNLDLDVIDNKSPQDVQFVVDMKRQKAYPNELINPHSVSHMFQLNPRTYVELADAPDFLTAKRKVYSDKNFNLKKLRFDRNFIHLEDWRSLNHPPVADLGKDLTIWDKDYTPIDYSKKESVFFSEDFHKRIDELSQTELSFGNKVELLANGDSFQRKLDVIRGAKSSVLVAVMSFFCDNSSRELEEVLKEKAKEIDVKIMVEKVWTKLAMKKCMNRMKRAGVDVVYSNDLLKKGEESALFHNKFMIIDGKKVVMGGSNIVESDNISTGFNHMNRDNDVYVEGPIASDAMKMFTVLFKRYQTKRNEKNLADPRVKDISYYEKLADEQMVAERAQGLRGQNVYAEKLADLNTRNKGVCRFMTQHPAIDKYLLSKVFIEHINESQERINMTTGSIYFDLPSHEEKERARMTWNKRLFNSVFAATDRGVKLDLVGNGIDGGYGEMSNMINRINHKSRFKFKPIVKTLYSILTGILDKSAAKKNQPYLEYLQTRKNTRAWASFQYMHSKLIQIDRVMNIVSSYNLEEWSGDKSQETGILCMDEDLSHQMDRSFLKDFVNSVPGTMPQ